MPARLKVFQAHLGFFDTVVAAPSQKAALDAWGSSQNLFRDGAATVATDPQAIKAALQKPGIVLKRLAGSGGEFAEQPPLPGNIPKAHRKKAAMPKPPPAKAAKPTKPPGGVHVKPLPDHSKLEAAERELADLREEHQRVLAELREHEQTLREERKSREHEFEQREKALQDERQMQTRELDRREFALTRERELREREFSRKESALEHRLTSARRS